jgi:hypothetical protein
MSEMEARSWWADVQHLRETLEQRQTAPPPQNDPVFAPLTLVDDEPAPRGFNWDPSDEADELFEDRPRTRRFERDTATSEPVPAVEADVEPDVFIPGPAAVAEQRQGVRHTVTITGRPVSPAATPGLVEVQSRRPARRAVERIGPRPDRIAMWAVALGLLLCIVALATASHP